MRKHSNGDEILDWLGLNNFPNWRVSQALGSLMTVLFISLFSIALFAAIGLLLRVLVNDGPPSLGSGALVAAILGSPFLVWGTILKHRAVSFQKEGHITDRISRAVDQLGAEKTEKKPLEGSSGEKVSSANQAEIWEISKPIIVEVCRPNIEVRIGGILSLERIAQDSTTYDGGRDHVRIMEILCAYIRENSQQHQVFPLSKWVPLNPSASADTEILHGSELSSRIGTFRTTSKADEWVRTLPRLRIDIQLALSVIGRRTERQRFVEAVWPGSPREETETPFGSQLPKLRPTMSLEDLRSQEAMSVKREMDDWTKAIEEYSGYRLDLRGSNLQGADFSAKRKDGSDADFSGALLAEAKMDGANFEGAKLRGALFSRSSLVRANFNYADLVGAEFRSSCQLEAASFVGANLSSARFSEAKILGGVFTGANLDFASIDASLIEGAWFLNNQARFASFSSLNCFGVRTRAFDVSLGTMQGVEHGASFFKSDGVFSGAAIMKIDLTDVDISKLDLCTLLGDISVVLPEGTVRPPHWPTVEIGWLDFDEEVARWRRDPSGYSP